MWILLLSGVHLFHITLTYPYCQEDLWGSSTEEGRLSLETELSPDLCRKPGGLPTSYPLASVFISRTHDAQGPLLVMLLGVEFEPLSQTHETLLTGLPPA